MGGEIYIAGDFQRRAHPVDAGIKRRFPEQYEAWKRKESGSHIIGMPLSKWPMATPGMIRELESVNVFSVEDLASVSDYNVQNITDGRTIREKAIAWLKSATEGAAAMQYAAENLRLREEMAELRKMVHASVGNSHEDERPPLSSRAVARLAENREKNTQYKAASRRRKKAKASGWTPERRAKQAEVFKARIAAKKAGVADESSWDNRQMSSKTHDKTCSYQFAKCLEYYSKIVRHTGRLCHRGRHQ
jgi:hypothetical protein